MAGKTAILAIKIIADGKQAGREFNETNAEVAKFDEGLKKAAIGATVAIASITALAVAAGNAASSLQQSTGAVESVFGEYADGIKANAEAAAEAVGLSKNSYQELASVLGAQLKNMGIPMEEVAGQTDELVKLGADLAATFGGSTSDAVSALSSLMRGERDPIERYGVSIKQADIAAELAAQGLEGLEGEAAKAAETQAVLALLTRQTSSVTGQFAREANTAAGAQQRANAAWENALAALGEQLLPIMAFFAEKLSELADWIGENTELVTGIAIAVGVFAGAILVANGAISAYRTISAIATAAQIAWNVAMSANPIGLIILAIGALVAAIVWVIANWEEVSRVAGEVWQNVIGWIQQVADWLNLDEVFANLVAAFLWIKTTAAEVWESVIGGISAVIGWVRDAIDWFFSLFQAAGTAQSKATSAAKVSYGGWTPADDLLFRLYASTATAPPGEDGTGAWPAWSAQPVSSNTSAETHYHFTFPNYVGDRDDLIEWLEQAMSDAASKRGRLVTA